MRSLEQQYPIGDNRRPSSGRQATKLLQVPGARAVSSTIAYAPDVHVRSIG